MADAPIVTISTKDADLDDDTREAVDRRCRALAEEFPETTHFEITVAQDGAGHVANARVTGKNTELAGQGEGAEPRQAADRLLDHLERQLRRVHDKRIFQRRREARRNPPKRGT